MSLSSILRILTHDHCRMLPDERLFRRSYRVVWNILNDEDKNPGDKEALLEGVRKRNALQRKRPAPNELLDKLHPCIMRWLEMHVPVRTWDWKLMRLSFQALEHQGQAPPSLHVRQTRLARPALDAFLLKPPPTILATIEARLAWLFVTCSKVADESGYVLRLPVQNRLDEFEYVARPKTRGAVHVIVVYMTRHDTPCYRLYRVDGEERRKHLESYWVLQALVPPFRASLGSPE